MQNNNEYSKQANFEKLIIYIIYINPYRVSSNAQGYPSAKKYFSQSKNLLFVIKISTQQQKTATSVAWEDYI